MIVVAKMMSVNHQAFKLKITMQVQYVVTLALPFCLNTKIETIIM